MRYLILIILLWIVTIRSTAYYSAPPRFEFTHIGVDEGLPQNSVVCILQDNKGFMWFGTYLGLCRYDGHRFKVFYHNPKDSCSLSNDMVWYLAEDHEENLWVATWDGGLNRFNRETET